MAKDKNEEFIALKKQISENKLEKVYLFFGEETFLKNTYLQKIKDMIGDGGFPDFNRILLDADSYSHDAVDDALEAFPMFCDNKLVIIRDSEIFNKPKDEEKDYWNARLQNIPEYVTLIFDESKVDKRSTTYKSVGKVGKAVEFNYLSKTDIALWIEREAKRKNRKITKSNAEYMAIICNSGLGFVKNELDKLVDFCDEEITKSDIERLSARSMDAKIFDLSNAIMEKNTNKALSLMSDFKTTNEPVFGILYSLSSVFDKMLRVKLELKEGTSYSDISAKTGILPFLVKNYAKNAKAFSEEYLIDRIIRVAETDYAVKNGEIGEWTALEQYILESFL